MGESVIDGIACHPATIYAPIAKEAKEGWNKVTTKVLEEAGKVAETRCAMIAGEQHPAAERHIAEAALKQMSVEDLGKTGSGEMSKRLIT